MAGPQPELPEWATDATQIIDPPGGLKLTGWIPNTVPPAQFFNWILNILCQWVLYLAGARAGVLVGRPRLFTNPPVAGIGVFVDGVRTVNLAAGSFDMSAMMPMEVPGAILTPSTQYYVYAWNNAGAIDLTKSTTAPDDTLTWMSTGIGTFAYLGCFRTDGGGAPIPFLSVGGEYLWRTSLLSRVVLAGGTALGATTVDCSAWCPPHVRMLRMHMDSANSGAATHSASIMRPGDPEEVVQVVSVAAARATQQVDVVCGVQEIEYLVSDATMALTLAVQGFRE